MTRRKFLIPLVLILILIIPVFALAQTPPATTGSLFDQCNTGIYNLIDLLRFPLCFARKYIFRLLVALASIVFSWRIVNYIRSNDSEKIRKDAPEFVLYGLLGIFFMLSIISWVRLLGSTTSIGQGGSFDVPQFKEE